MSKIRDSLQVPYHHFGRGVWYDIKNRYPLYKSDITDGLKDVKSISKSLSASIFIYFACLLPSIAFGNLNADTTDNWISVQKTIFAQAIGGLVFGLFSAQPLVILLTTAPIAIYITIIRDLAEALGTDLMTLYTLTGLFNVMFLILYAMFNLSSLMKFSTRSVEEIFGIFITCAFSKEAITHIVEAFQDHYYDYKVESVHNTTHMDLRIHPGKSQNIIIIAQTYAPLYFN